MFGLITFLYIGLQNEWSTFSRGGLSQKDLR